MKPGQHAVVTNPNKDDRAILLDAAASFSEHRAEAFELFREHGQDWVGCIDCGAQWSVSRPCGFEQVTEGDGECGRELVEGEDG